MGLWQQEMWLIICFVSGACSAQKYKNKLQIMKTQPETLQVAQTTSETVFQETLKRDEHGCL